MPITPLPHARRALRLAAVAVLVAACSGVGGAEDGAAFRDDYNAARQALEAGNYARAARGYEALLDAGSPVDDRVRLEYAHTLLRADRFADAATAAGALLDSDSTAVRASARAVRGTARHEAAATRRADGADTAELIALLEAAQSDIRAFLADHADLDAGAAMQARATSIGAELATLR